jgi:hypothetical protein
MPAEAVYSASLPMGMPMPFRAQIAQAQDALPISDHDNADVLLRPIAKDLRDAALVLRGDVVEAFCLPEDVREFAGMPAPRWGCRSVA